MASDTYHFVSRGGHPAVDLVNTVSWRTDPARRLDRLGSPEAVVAWAEVAGLSASAADVRPTPADGEALHAIRSLRLALITVLDAHVDGSAPPARDLRLIRSRYAAAVVHADATSGLPLRWTLTPQTLPAIAARLALDAVDLLGGPDVARLRRCEGDACGWFFLDGTRNHSRRWCDAGDCGNRERVRRYAAAHRPARRRAAGAQKIRPQ